MTLFLTQLINSEYKAVSLNHQIGKSNRECQLTLRTIMGDRTQNMYEGM